MTTANEAYKRAANSPVAREAAATAKSIGEDVSETVSDFASDVSRIAGKQYGRARDAAVDAYDQVHEASVRNPHLTLAIALGIGFLFGIVAATRR
jgi:ElaB/YqjD/DUF883 family membrane-anchored ribosome-binding protein